MSEYLCKDCKYSRVSFINKLFTLGGRVNDDEVHYKCAKFPERETVELDVVLGPKKVKAKLPYCSLTRREYGPCGEGGKHWSPKHKKDLFKVLTKEHYD